MSADLFDESGYRALHPIPEAQIHTGTKVLVPHWEQGEITGYDTTYINITQADPFYVFCANGQAYYPYSLATPAGGDPLLSRITLPDGEIRIWEPNVHENDLGRMYVLDVLGVDVLIREREGEIYVHLDTTDAETERPGDKPVAYEVNNTGDNLIGDPYDYDESEIL